MVLKGRSALSDAELIAILLGSGSRNESAVSLAQRILANASNHLQEIGNYSINDLKKFKGVGEAKAVTIAAALEIGRRRTDESIEEKIKITSSKLF